MGGKGLDDVPERYEEAISEAAARTVQAITGMPTAAAQRVSKHDVKVLGRPSEVEASLRQQLANHARDSATYLVPSSVEVEWTCRVSGVVFAYPFMHGPDEESIQEQRRDFEAGAHRAYEEARHGYGLVRWAAPK